MKKLLFLGGALHQVPIIQRANELGIYTITCDYTPQNPGHKIAREYHNVSTIDKEGVLKLARELQIDGIVAYASDPAAPTAAYVAEKQGLPGNPCKSVEILTEKDKFRKFLAENGFNCPQAKGFSSFEETQGALDGFRYPLMVKPVDASGSKGVVKIESPDELKAAVDEALSYSHGKRIVVEEFIEKKGYQVSGDGFSVDGKLVFTSYGNELYSDQGVRSYVALGEFWPSLLSDELLQKIDDELQRLITKLDMKTCAYNIEVILDKNDDVYILELGPRNGGSYIPQLIRYATGVDMLDYTLWGALGEDCSALKRSPTKGFWSNYMLLSRVDGKFQEIWFNEAFKQKNLFEVHCTCQVGDQVYAYRNTTHSLGTILFKADSLEEIIEITSNMDRYYKVIVK